MTYEYSNPRRASDPHSLPDVEVFYHDGRYSEGDCFSPECNDGEALQSGWYYWFRFPGCMPDSEPSGPFESEGAALADARENSCDDESDDDESDD